MRVNVKLSIVLILLMCITACEERTESSTGLNASSSVTEEHTSELFAQANKALINGETDQALVLCEQGLVQGDQACHRLIGIAYKQKKDPARACAAFTRALELKDPHTITIERYVKHLHCDQVLKNAHGSHR